MSDPVIMMTPDLIDRLVSMRRVIRRRLAIYGSCAVLAGGIIALLTVMVVDWLLWLPAPLRLLVAVFFFAGFVLAVRHWIVVPLRARIGLDQIADQLERRYNDLGDRLSTTVDLLQEGTTGSPALVHRVVAGTNELVRDLPLETTLSHRPAWVSSIVLSGAIIGLLSVAVGADSWVRTGLHRYVRPFDDVNWPTRVSMEPLDAPDRVAIGDLVTLKMSVTRGMDDDLRGLVYLRDGRNSTSVLTMLRDGGSVFEATVDTVTEDLTYWFEAGDASTKQRPLTIQAVHRPEVVEATVLVDPPPYTLGITRRKHDLSKGPAKATVGGSVLVTIESSKPMGGGDTGSRNGLQWESGEWVALVVDESDPRRATAGWSVTQDVRFYPKLVDADGFENRGAPHYSLDAVPDTPPVVSLLEPRATIELTPRGVVKIIARIQDDLGIERVELSGARTATGEPFIFDLTNQCSRTVTAEGVTGLLNHSWSLEPLALSPGEEVTATLVAFDNHEGSTFGGQLGRGSPFRIVVISELEFDVRLRDEIALLEGHLRKVLLEEISIRDEISQLTDDQRSPVPTRNDLRGASGVLAGRQSRLARQTRDLAGRFFNLQLRVEQNAMHTEGESRQLAGVTQSIQSVAVGPMVEASSRLTDVAGGSSSTPDPGTLNAAAGQTGIAVDQLQAILAELSRWGSFQGMVARTRDLLQRLHQIHTSTLELSRQIIGKSLEGLSDLEAATLRRTERAQAELARNGDQLLARLAELSEESRQRDPAAGEALDAAIRAARANDLSQRLRSAATALAENRTAAATVEQRAAAQGLEKMVSALRTRERRALELLQARVRGFEETLAELLGAQRALRAASAEVIDLRADPEVLTRLAEEQERVRRNTLSVANDMAESEGAAEAAPLVQSAGTAMTEAQRELDRRSAGAALPFQDQAIEDLTAAAMRLGDLADEIDQQALSLTLSQLREELEQLHQGQSEVHARLVSLEEVVRSRGSVGRVESREATRLAQEQAALRSTLMDVLPQVSLVPVYDWALRRVAEWMNSVRQRLEGRSIDTELTLTSWRIVGELRQLVEAARSTENLPLVREFDSATQGGGGGSQGPQRRPIPPVAELMVLRAKQVDINARTLELAKAGETAPFLENELRLLRVIAEDQAEVRRLTERVTAKAREP